MRLSLLSSVLCAIGTLGSHVHNHKRVYVTDLEHIYVTDLIVVTVTTTVTVQPTSDPVADVAVERVQIQAETTSANAPPIPVVSSQSGFIQAPAVTSQSESIPAPSSVAPEEVTVITTKWTSALTSSALSSAPTTLMTTTAPPAAAPTDSYEHLVLFNHNIHRSNHSASDMIWSSSLEASAYKLAAACVYHHDTSIDGGGYGQNIGYGIPADHVGEMISNLMYNDEFEFFKPYFGVADPDMSNFDRWGHLTQIVWKASTQVGCATVVCDTLGNVDFSSPLPFTVCNYGPPGNVEGEYAENVGLPQGQPIYSP